MGDLGTFPRVFVGTLHSGEGDFPACEDAVRRQRGVVVQHSTFSGLPEKEAHNALWHAWREAQVGCSMFVKVDADTVLAHDEVLLELWRMMRANPRITGIQAPLLDYFTDGSINGLNCFSPRVTFNDTESDLFCDRGIDVDHDVVVKADGVPERLSPAGYHAFNPTDVQALHYGLHRALKGQASVIMRVRSAWLRHRDRHRALALIGAGLAPGFTAGGFNYVDERFQAAARTALDRYDELIAGLAGE